MEVHIQNTIFIVASEATTSPSCSRVFQAQLSVDLRSHPQHCHHPNYLPKHGHLHPHPTQSSLLLEILQTHRPPLKVPNPQFVSFPTYR
uniref:Uncharacterized protein n=1 Tax=Anguilla anguilla TaxID=7936 RepID=A0A0E9WHY7_ANGAN